MSLSVSNVNGQVVTSKTNKKAVQLAKSTAGIVTGTVIYAKLPKLIKKAMIPYKNWVIKSLQEETAVAELGSVKNAVRTAFEQTGLKENGFKIQNINTRARVFEVSREMNSKFDLRVAARVDKLKKVLPEKLTNALKLNTPESRHASQKARDFLDRKLMIILDGKNAFCSPATKDIAVNLEKIPMTAFHEMGHGLNTMQPVGKILSKIRGPLQILGVPLILAVGLLKRKKSEGEKPNGSFDKSTTFIKDNAGKLTFAAWIPTLLEEGLASIKGAKMAKDAGLSKELLKKLNISNAKAWSTYMIGALAAASTVRLAVAVKDRIAEGRQKKNKTAAEKIAA